jgi:hypothetical protein
LAQSGVFGGRVAVVGDSFPASQFQESSAPGLVKIMQWQRIHALNLTWRMWHLRVGIM